MREFRGLPIEELGNRIGMPVARFLGDEDKRLALTDEELTSIAVALNVPVDPLIF